jgi:transposase
MTNETPTEKRRRLMRKRAMILYERYKADKSVYRKIANEIGISYNTAKTWVENNQKKAYD